MSATSTQQIKICFIEQLELHGIHFGPFHYSSFKLPFLHVWFFFIKEGTVIKARHADTCRLMIKYVI